MEMTLSQLAELTGLDRSTVTRKLVDTPCRDRGKGGKFFNTQVALRAIYLGSAEDGALDAQAERAKLDKARRELAELDFAVKRRELLREESVFKALDTAAVAFKSRLQGIPGQFATVFAGETDAKVIEKLLDREIYQALLHVTNERDKYSYGSD